MAFHIGQQVVCVNDLPTPGFTLEGIRKGCVYTVRAVGIHGFAGWYEPEMCVWLEEVYREDSYEKDVPFLASRFRPVQRRKTSIEVFTALLNTKSEKELV